MGKHARTRSTKTRKKRLFDELEKEMLCLFQLRKALLIWVMKRPLIAVNIPPNKRAISTGSHLRINCLDCSNCHINLRLPWTLPKRLCAKISGARGASTSRHAHDLLPEAASGYLCTQSLILQCYLPGETAPQALCRFADIRRRLSLRSHLTTHTLSINSKEKKAVWKK
jgi:hypothetical protein